MNTRQLEPSDAEIAQAVVKKFHGQDVSTGYMVKFLSNPVNFLVIAQEGDDIIGFIMAHQLDRVDQEAMALFIYELEVAEGHRRKGAGRALLNHVRDIAAAQQMLEMYVFTNHSNTGAVAFYQATGGQVEEGDELMFVYPGTAGDN